MSKEKILKVLCTPASFLGLHFKHTLTLLTTFLFKHIHLIANQRFSALQTSLPGSKQAPASWCHCFNSITFVQNICCGSNAIAKLGKGSPFQSKASF